MSEMVGKSIERAKEKQPKAPPHEISATANLIEEAGLFSKKYGRTYWMGKVKRAGVSHNEMIGILKEIKGMDPKYSKGGRLTNVLTEKAKALKKLSEKNKSQKNG